MERSQVRVQIRSFLYADAVGLVAGDGWTRAVRNERRLPLSECMDNEPFDRKESASDGVDSRRGKCRGLQPDSAARADACAQRCSRCQHRISTWGVRFSCAPCVVVPITYAHLGELWTTRSDCGAQVDPKQHCGVWWRSPAGDDIRAVFWQRGRLIE